ncbi:ankyrin, partial [Gonapodya prolifera JEL478]
MPRDPKTETSIGLPSKISPDVSFLLLSLPTDIILHLSTFLPDRFGLPTSALNHRLHSLLSGDPSSTAIRALRHYSTPRVAILAETRRKNPSIQVVRILLSHETEPVDADLLLAAVDSECEEIVRLFLGSHIKGPECFGTPLCKAAEHGSDTMVQLFLEFAAKQDAQGNENGKVAGSISDALWYASYKGHLPVARSLIAAGADIHYHSGTAVAQAAYSGNLELMKYLLDLGALLNSAEEELELPLTRACMSGKLKMVRFLIERGADPFARQGEVLVKGCRNGYPNAKTIEFFLDLGVARTPGFYPKYVFHRCCDIGCTAVLEKLVLDMVGATDIHSINVFKGLYSASSSGHTGVVRVILEAWGTTHGRTYVQELLDWTHYDTHLTALGAAISRGHKETVATLVEFGARDLEMWTFVDTAGGGTLMVFGRSSKVDSHSLKRL